MARKRRTFSAEFKARVVKEVLRERDTMAHIARKYELHPNQINKWKSEFLKGMSSVFGQRQEADRERLEKELSKAYEEIGRLKVERDWLKKSLDGTIR